MSRAELTKIGIYIVIILVIIKFAVTTFSNKLKEKREILSETVHTYYLKKDIYEKKLAEIERSSKAPEAINFIYNKKYSYNSIRNTVLNWLIEEAERKGLSIVNFELPEIKKGKTLSEINVTLRLKGKIKPFIDLLEIVEQADKLILVKNTDILRTGQDFNMVLTVSFFRSEI